MIGKQILHYKIVEKLGEGGMAAVYRAEDTRLHRQVALKFLPAEALEREEDRARFVSEARAAAALDHPNICTVHEINEADGHHFISMAYVEGRDIKEIVDSDGPMTILDAAKTAVQIAEGLAAAHEEGFVHRDIKSANIMVTPKGRVKIMDFGLAYRDIAGRTNAESQTMGTVAYGSPEQLRGGAVDHHSDIWSFGVTLYEMLTGELPFKGDYESAIVYSVINEVPASPRELRPEVPEEFDRIVMKALSKKPEDRYSSVEEMLEELVQVRNGVDPTISKAFSAAETAAGGVGGWMKRVMISAGVYLGFTWLVVRLVGLFVGRMQLSPEIVRMSSIGLVSLLPAVLLIAFVTTRREEGGWGKPGWIGVSANLLVSAALLIVMFSGKDLGAVTESVEVTDEDGVTTERVIPKNTFRKRFAMYVFDNASADSTVGWLQYAIPILIETDVLQDPFLEVRSSQDRSSFNRLKESGFDSWVGAPLALKRKIAEEANMDHFVSGTVGRQNDEYVVNVQVYETKSGKRVSETPYRNTDLFEMVDEITRDLMGAVDVPAWHLDGAPDVPVAEMVTDSEDAMRAFALAQKAIVFDSDWNSAIENLEAATEADSTFAFAYFAKYMVYRVTNQSARSFAALDAALRHAYKTPERVQFIIKANYYFAKQQPEKVLAVADMMTELYPDDLLAHQMKAEVHTLRYETDEAIAVYKRIIELDPLQPEHLNRVAQLYEMKGDHESALEYRKEFAKAQPENPTSFQEIGEVYRHMGEFQKAKQSYEKALLLDPERISFLATAALNEFNLGHLDDAHRQLRSALDLSRNSADSVTVFHALGTYYELRGEYGKAIDTMRALFDEQVKISAPLQAYITAVMDMNIFVHAGREEEGFAAMKEIDAAVTAPPFDKAISFGYLRMYVAMEDPDRAEEALADVGEYIQSLGLEILRPRYHRAQGRIHELREELDEAITAYERMLESDPNNPGALHGIGRCRRKQGHTEQAIELLEKCAKYRPFHGGVNYDLALAYHQAGRQKEADEHLDRALKVWEHADPSYKTAAEARATKREWQTASNL